MTTLQELFYGNIRPNQDEFINDEDKRLVQGIVSLIECQAFEIEFKLALKIPKQ